MISPTEILAQWMSSTLFRIRLEDYDRFLMVGPHPDDLELGCGAAAARLAAQGKQVLFLVCTDGRYGRGHLPKDLTAEQTIALRQEEARRAAACLGVPVRFLDFSDGGFYEPRDLFLAIGKVMDAFQPQVLFVTDPQVRSELHPDHLNAGRCVSRLAVQARNEGVMAQYGLQGAPVRLLLYYASSAANFRYDVSGYTGRQRAALGAYQSQFPSGSVRQKQVFRYVRVRQKLNGLAIGAAAAEDFRALTVDMMHGLPEADLF